jgi:hypothetical protein
MRGETIQMRKKKSNITKASSILEALRNAV